uniref:Kinesinlike protein putative n=1 Tax=Albugo laibachii Nc14 TaxID=890382 RepID=F0W8L6_9STRA|nr:kinesinlike protein putative [Albugo laibachii Nc14]|eukprot:CCA17471.1 kinesinlike protein putative [Albugo laibachii Nc14]
MDFACSDAVCVVLNARFSAMDSSEKYCFLTVKYTLLKLLASFQDRFRESSFTASMELKTRNKTAKTGDTTLESDKHDPNTSISAIKVVVRVRPLNAKELGNRSPIILNVQNSSIQVANPAGFNDSKHPATGNTENASPKHLHANAFASEDCRTFHFDRCFTSPIDPASDIISQDIDPVTGKPNQLAIFDEVGVSMIDSAFQGFHCTVLAYGQTGSGKTHTMFGDKESGQQGLIPRVCEALFHDIDLKRENSQESLNAHTTFHVDVTYCEIYKEKVIDLLDEENTCARNRPSSAPPDDTGVFISRKPLKIREHPVTGPFIEGLITQSVHSYEEIALIMATGEKARTVGSTLMNSVSSRSHAVFTITLTQAYRDPGSLSCHDEISKISLVDLAGSERALNAGTSGERLKEGAMINKSLTTLGRVISALSKKSVDRVPYRDSALTWLLKESLGGNAKTTMMAMVSPAAENYDETMSTLRYAESAKKVINCALVNEDENTKIVRSLRQEIMELREALSKLTIELEPSQKPRELEPSPKPREKEEQCVNVEANAIFTNSNRPILVNLDLVDAFNAIAYGLQVGITVFGRGNQISIECSCTEDSESNFQVRLSSEESVHVNDERLSCASSIELFHGDCIRYEDGMLRLLIPGIKVREPFAQVCPLPPIPEGNMNELVDGLNALCQRVGVIWSFQNEGNEVVISRMDQPTRVAWSSEEVILKYDKLTQVLGTLQELLPASPSLLQKESIAEVEEIPPSDTPLCARLHGYARITLCTTQLARASDCAQAVSLVIITPTGKCIGNAELSYSKPGNTCEYHLQRLAFYANAVTSECISVIIKHCNAHVEHTIPMSLDMHTKGDQIVVLNHRWRVEGNSEMALLEVWGHGRVLVPASLGEKTPYSPPRIDFFVSADIQECDSDGNYVPVAVKKDGTLRLHLNQARKISLRIVQADTASFCLREILMVKISSVRRQRLSMWRDAFESGKCAQSASAMSLRSPVSDPQNRWKDLEILEVSTCDFASRTLCGTFDCKNDEEVIDPKKSRSIFQLAVSFRQQYNATPIVIFKSIVVKICPWTPKNLPLRQRISRGWEATRTAWWAKESYSRNFRLGTWFTAELLMEKKRCNDDLPARNVAGALMETLAHGMDRMEAIMSLEVVRQLLLAMIPIPSDGNVEILRKVLEKNVPETSMCVEMESQRLFLTLKSRKGIRLCLTDANRLDEKECEPVPFLITEPARFGSKDALKYVQAAPWQSSVAEMCGFLDIHRCMQLGTAANAIVTNGSSVKWQRRWFVLRRPFLYAYKSMARKEQVGVIEITKCQIIVPMTLSAKNRRHSLPVFWKAGGKDTGSSERQPPFTFQLWSQTGSRSLIWSFRASSCAELRAWLVAIDPLKIEACNALRPIPESCDLPAMTA